jgi:enoyl-CoA hydratase
MKFNNLLYQLEDGILTITINRPDKLNALNQATMADIKAAFEAAGEEPDLKGVIITGAGEKAFVAGADISEFKGRDEDSAKDLAAHGHKIFNRIEEFNVPVIAAVNGFALGGGCELAMACHLRIASENAKFGQPEVNLGIIPGYGGTQRLVQLIGKGRALELLMTGDMVDANTALQYGLVNHIVPQAELLAKAKAIIEKIATKAPVAIQRVIDCVNAYYEVGEDGFKKEIKSFAKLFNTEDWQEGVNAFLEKRRPDFKGK